MNSPRNEAETSDAGFDGAWLEETAERATATLRARVQDAPYVTLGAAIGLGLVIGGGLWRPIARSIVGLGARVALSTVVPALIDRITVPTKQAPKPAHNPEERT